MIQESDFYHLPEGTMFLVSQKALIIEDNKLLILEIPPDDVEGWSNKWQLPGGLLDMNESMEDGLKREIKEETGLEIAIGKPAGTSDCTYDNFLLDDGKKYKVRFIGFAYECVASKGEVRLSHEHQSYQWATKEELKGFEFSPDSAPIIQAYLQE